MDRELDVSDLEPPEPLERILDALMELRPGERLVVRHRRLPYPLFDLLRRMGHRYEAAGEEGGYHILIWPIDE
ncbi:MAG: DUF2249 domain-containing protein [Gammaproteobacteria bacterium]|jgi:uncharacterized protein (DUF2249 family)|nr:DUF2249 domain-containing protein [Gammaproteobacteria bacterium]